MKLETIQLLAVTGVIAKSLAWFFLAWMCIEILIHIDNHGLRHLLLEIWNGPVQE